MPEPNAIGIGTPGERVVFARDPFGQRGAPCGLGMVGGQIKFKIFLFKEQDFLNISEAAIWYYNI